MEMTIKNYDAVIIGSGAAGLSAATCLFQEKIENIAIITEGLYMGTSINTGSDKQTYYKLSTTGDEKDSVLEMAKTLYHCGGMEGYHALSEAALSLRCFFKLVELGVPFPMNEYGEYVGYRTDHDERKRASSCGPLTSKYMCEALIERVKEQGTDIFENRRAVKLVCENEKVYGVVVYDFVQDTFEIYQSENIILATGGAAGIYSASVYPKAQSGGIGIALEQGAVAVNLTEWQYGIASTEFRWNLSGSYQQVIPRYLSLDGEGQYHEFLTDYIDEQVFDLIFQKGYNWPFSPKNLCRNKSSLIDIAVYIEQNVLQRQVFLDFTKNPTGLNKSKLSEETVSYFKNSGLSVEKTPIERLRTLNEQAYRLYLDNGIDLEHDLLAIDVCAQHCNGGLACDANYMTNIDGLFACGECAGVFGITRPGGTALNSTQVSSMRASFQIKKRLETAGNDDKKNLHTIFETAMNELNEIKDNLFSNKNGITPIAERNWFSACMSKSGAFIREKNQTCQTFEILSTELSELYQHLSVKNSYQVYEAFVNRDLLISALAVLFAQSTYLENGGKSRGGFLVLPNGTDLISYVKHSIELNMDLKTVIDVIYNGKKYNSRIRTVSKLPNSEQWFEKVAFGNDKRQ